jgi:hypothetical protein
VIDQMPIAFEFSNALRQSETQVALRGDQGGDRSPRPQMFEDQRFLSVATVAHDLTSKKWPQKYPRPNRGSTRKTCAPNKELSAESVNR